MLHGNRSTIPESWFPSTAPPPTHSRSRQQPGYTIRIYAVWETRFVRLVVEGEAEWLDHQSTMAHLGSPTLPPYNTGFANRNTKARALNKNMEGNRTFLCIGQMKLKPDIDSLSVM